MSETTQIASWALPQVDGPVVGRRRRREDLQLIEREAWDTGYAAGRDSGLAAARAEQQRLSEELRERAQRFGHMLNLLARPLQDLDNSVYESLGTVVEAIVRQLMRRELKTAPEQIVGVVRSAVSELPMAARDVRVHLHPEDAALLREKLAEPSSDHAWRIVEDPVLTRGGCRVSSENSTIDARLETRIGAAVALALGEARAQSDTAGRT
jgi:flagellar assembly protein FliH